MQSGFHRTRTRGQSWNSKDQPTCGWNLHMLRVATVKGTSPGSERPRWPVAKQTRLPVPSFRSFLLWSCRTLSERDGKAQSRKRSHPSLAQGPLLLLQPRGMQCDYFWETVTPGLASSWLNHKALLSPVGIAMLVAPGKGAEHRMEREFPILSVKDRWFRTGCIQDRWVQTVLSQLAFHFSNMATAQKWYTFSRVSSLVLCLPTRTCLQSCPSSQALYLGATASSPTFKYSYHSLYHSKKEWGVFLILMSSVPDRALTSIIHHRQSQISVCSHPPGFFSLSACVFTSWSTLILSEYNMQMLLPPNKRIIWRKTEGRKLTEPMWPLYILAQLPGAFAISQHHHRTLPFSV